MLLKGIIILYIEYILEVQKTFCPKALLEPEPIDIVGVLTGVAAWVFESGGLAPR